MTSYQKCCSCLLLCIFLAVPVQAELSEFFQAMNEPAEPFQIIGNLYYVGANSVASYLITTPDGHILIDSGFAETVPMIRSGMKKLGFRFEDIKVLLNSHAHMDHCGGLEEIKQETGAELYASALDAPLLERGGLGDDLWGDDLPFTAVQVDHRLDDGDTVEFGGITLTARVTAGHTRGCTSWDFEVERGQRTFRAVSICSLSVLEGMKFGKEATYPGIRQDFERSFETLEAIPADIFLASHATFFNMKQKRELLTKGAGMEHPFVDPQGYRAYIAKARQRFEDMVAAEESGTAAQD